MSLTLRIFTEPQQGASYDALLAVAREAEALGFDAFFRSDHYLKMGDVSGLPGPTDAWVTLAGLARETERIRLGTMVTAATFRLPGPLAIAVAQVDAMSGGRVELGIGAGWYDDEHTAYGVPFPPLGERFERLEEQLAVVTGLWETPAGQTFSHVGRHYRLADSPALPKPVQRPRPPVIVGGFGRSRTPRLAARYADEFNVPFAPVDGFRDQMANVAAACEAADRDPKTMTWSAAVVLCCGADEDEFRRRAAAIGREPAELRENGVGGTVAEVVDRLGAYAEAGAERAYLQVLDLQDLDHLRLVAAEVAPALA
ncbi:MAG TPA: LLM class F420-dependent oxidoreductase [Acidimicrobiales bacterium]|nr:LLM class F420-dependent oxidoreductase [Acidimicrobiales bacterium]